MNDKNINTEIPTFEEFLEYAKTLNNYHSKLDYNIKEKYISYKNNGWRSAHDSPILNWEKLLKNQLPFIKSSEEKITNNKFQEWGKLGGRPKKDIRKTKTISTRFTEEEFNKIKEDFEESKLDNFTDFCRFRLQNKNPEERAENAEINKRLIKTENNFSRLTNIIKMGIFTQEEKFRFLNLLEETAIDVRNAVKW